MTASVCPATTRAAVASGSDPNAWLCFDGDQTLVTVHLVGPGSPLGTSPVGPVQLGLQTSTESGSSIPAPDLCVFWTWTRQRTGLAQDEGRVVGTKTSSCSSLCLLSEFCCFTHLKMEVGTLGNSRPARNECGTSTGLLGRPIVLIHQPDFL